MKKILSLLSATLFTTFLFSQAVETNNVEVNKTLLTGKTQQKQIEALNNRNKNDDKLNMIEITGVGGSVFSTMNYPDISTKISTPSLKITLLLLTGVNKAGGYQLVFSPESERTAYAVETQTGITSIFFPMHTFEIINQKLDQYIASKKKVQLKITQNPNGFREGVLTF
jgi:hypothetical protein